MFTCNTCMIQFQSGDLQRYHMKTEWHRYNLKRRVAQLPPISADVFVQKLQASQKEQALNQVDEFGFPLLRPIPEKNGRHRKDGKGAKVATVPLLRKSESTFSVSSQLSKVTVHSTDYGEHSASEYGFTTEDSYDELDSDYSSDETDTEQVERKSSPVLDCIFCGSQSQDIEMNVEHMFKAHGLYIPERNYLANLNGLLKQIEYKIVVKNHCLCCKFKGVSLESIRAHIQSKSHCRIPYETREERSLWAKFYKFTIAEEANDGNTSESESTDDTLPSNGLEDINSNYSVVHVDQSGVEMLLPTGARVGHRGMQRYFRQNLAIPSAEAESRRTLTVVDRRFNNGITVTEYSKNKKHMEFLEKQAINRSINRQVRRSNFQRHYRDELLQ